MLTLSSHADHGSDVLSSSFLPPRHQVPHRAPPLALRARASVRRAGPPCACVPAAGEEGGRITVLGGG